MLTMAIPLAMIAVVVQPLNKKVTSRFRDLTWVILYP